MREAALRLERRLVDVEHREQLRHLEQLTVFPEHPDQYQPLTARLARGVRIHERPEPRAVDVVDVLKVENEAAPALVDAPGNGAAEVLNGFHRQPPVRLDDDDVVADVLGDLHDAALPLSV